MKNLIPLLALTAILPLAASAQQFSMREANGVRWVCGGVGTEERDALASLAAESNLSLVFTTAQRGAYVADVSVALYDAGAKKPRLEIQADGPVCMLHAPQGRYRVQASFNGTTRTSAAVVAQDAKKPARVVLVFPGDE